MRPLTALIAACILFAAVGVALVTWSFVLPEYKDGDRAQESIAGSCYPDSETSEAKRDACTAQWHRDMAAVRTNKWVFLDTGRGLLALAASILVGLAYFRWRGMRDWRDLRTPSSRVSILLAGAAIWIGQWPIFIARLIEEQQRTYFPPWADSIIIPMVNSAIFFAVMLPILIVTGWVCVLWKAKLPVSLWLWQSERRWRSIVWTILYGCASALLLLGLYSEIADGSFLMVPLLLIGLYLTLSARAAVLSRERRVRPPFPLLH